LVNDATLSNVVDNYTHETAKQRSLKTYFTPNFNKSVLRLQARKVIKTASVSTLSRNNLKHQMSS